MKQFTQSPAPTVSPHAIEFWKIHPECSGIADRDGVVQQLFFDASALENPVFPGQTIADMLLAMGAGAEDAQIEEWLSKVCGGGEATEALPSGGEDGYPCYLLSLKPTFGHGMAVKGMLFSLKPFGPTTSLKPRKAKEKTQGPAARKTLPDVLLPEANATLDAGHAETMRIINELKVEIGVRRRIERNLQEYAEELKRSNAELEEMAYVAANDFQEPLRMVNSYLKLIGEKEGTQFSPEVQEYFRYVSEGGRHMQQMLDDLLNFTNVAFKAKPFENCDLGKALKQALDRLEYRLQRKKATITCGPLPTVPADSAQMAQLFYHLLSNSLKFARRGSAPEIKISAGKTNEGYVTIHVQDNGIGLDEEHSHRVFRMFQRLHPKTAYPGTGIGLAICRKIVERHGGQIKVQSTIGSGATFSFSLATSHD